MRALDSRPTRGRGLVYLGRMLDAGSEYRIVLCTAGSTEQAAEIGRALVERRLAACVNVVGGIRSIYRWKGQVEDEAEALLVIKTHAARVEALRGAVRELHSYETPELIVLPIIDGDPDYLSWLAENL